MTKFVILGGHYATEPETYETVGFAYSYEEAELMVSLYHTEPPELVEMCCFDFFVIEEY